jgi:RNA polymerase sigma-70 factor, ECF subfamily
MAQPRHIAARHGSAAAFRVIMERNNRRLFWIARSLLKDDAEAEDTVQETYVSAFANLHRDAGTAALSTWLTRIALNEALGRLRRRRSMVEFDDDRAEFDAGADEAGARVIPFPLTQSTMPVSRTRSSAPI